MITALQMGDSNRLEQSSSRLLFVDVLRGYALFGVFLVRMVEYFSGWDVRETGAQLSNTDQLLHYFLLIFFNNKFRALFSFLFGLGFYFQLRKYEEKGEAFQANFIKRLLVLMIFGLAHAYFIWAGDILHWYALAGLVLLFLYRLNTKAIFIVAVFLSVVVPNLSELLQSVFASSSAGHTTHLGATLLQDPSYVEMIKANVTSTNQSSFLSFSAISFALTISGYFLLGIWAGRVQLLTQIEKYRPYFVPVCLSGLGVGLLGGLLSIVIPVLLEAGVLPPKGFILLLSLVTAQANMIGIFIFHLCLLVILFNKTWFNRKLTLLIPAGRMTLTNYILQSVMGVSIFYGFGLGYWGRFSLPVVVALTGVLFAIQVWCSHWWMQRFGQGPLEWLWRAMVSTRIGVSSREVPSKTT